MDAIKQKLGPVFRHGFWITTGIVTLCALGIWFWTTMTLSQEHEDQAAKLDADVNKVSMLRSELGEHPNEKSHAEMNVLIDQREAEVLEAWGGVFDRQEKILVWPDTLRQSFLDKFAGRIPVENFIDYPPLPEQEVNTELLRRYAEYIKEVLPEIAELADAEWTAEFKAAPAGGGMGDMGMDYGDEYGGDEGMMMGPASDVDITGTSAGPLVAWSTSSQEKVLQDLFPWKGTRPTVLQVHYSQENTWILRQLMQIVANVNAGATQSFQAKIREIKQIQIGESVEFEQGAVAEPGADEVMMGYGGDMEEDDMGYGDEYMMDGLMGGGTAGSASFQAQTPDPAEGRYLDLNNEPLAATTLRAALKSLNPNDAGLAVAKRVPVMMKVKIDQRFVPRLLASCGSAPLMVEVKQVRVLDPNSSGSAAGMFGGDEEMTMGSMMGGGVGPKDDFPFDVEVEVYGVINIYNPPRKEALGLDEVTEETSITGEQPKADEPAEPAPAPDAATPETLPAPEGNPGDAPAGDTPAPADETAPAAPEAAATGPPTAIMTGN